MSKPDIEYFLKWAKERGRWETLRDYDRACSCKQQEEEDRIFAAQHQIDQREKEA